MNEFKVRKGLIVQGSGSTLLDIQGSQGQLFSVTDSLTGSLFSVNDISGMPIMEVFSDDRINLGTFNAEAIKVSGSTASVTGSLLGTASFAQTASFLASTTNAFLQNGNSFGTQALIGTNDNQNLALETSGSTRMFISSSGLIGIGVTNPVAKLDIDVNEIGGYNINLRNSAGYEVKIGGPSGDLISNNPFTYGFKFGPLTVNPTTYTFKFAQFDVLYGTGLTPGYLPRINVIGVGNSQIYDDGTNIGIGTTNPSAKLHVYGGNIKITEGTGGDEQIEVSGGYLAKYNGLNNAWGFAQDRIYINGDTGNVGIGTTSPGAKLTVQGNISIRNSSGFDRTVLGIDGVSSSPYITLMRESDATVTVRLDSNSDSYLTGGNIGIGTTTPNAKLDVSGSLSQGTQTQATGQYSHAEGFNTVASGNYTHAEGVNTLAQEQGAHTEGHFTTGSGGYSHAEGVGTISSGSYSHAEGNGTIAIGQASHAEGGQTVSLGNFSHAEGQQTISTGQYSHAEGEGANASGSHSHAEGNYTIAEGDYSHAEGFTSRASGTFSHAEGIGTLASGFSSHAEGDQTLASGAGSHAEGRSTDATGNYSHAEGSQTLASGIYAHAEGVNTVASGDHSHTEGENTAASGRGAHAEGYYTSASGNYSHAEGYYTIANGSYQHVQGQYNAPSSIQSAFIVGNGVDDSNRSNLIFAAGNEVQITGSVTVTQGITGSLEAPSISLNGVNLESLMIAYAVALG